MNKKSNIVLIFTFIILIISISYNVYLLNKIEADADERNVYEYSLMKGHLMEFYTDIQKNSSFEEDSDIQSLFYLIDSLKEQCYLYIQISGYDLQVAQFLKRYIKILEAYRDNVLFGDGSYDDINIKKVVIDIQKINMWLYERGKKENYEVYNLNDLYNGVGGNLYLKEYLE